MNVMHLIISFMKDDGGLRWYVNAYISLDVFGIY